MANGGTCRVGNAYDDQCRNMEKSFKPGHVLLFYLNSRVACIRGVCKFAIANGHCKTITDDELMEVVSSMTMVVPSVLKSLPR
jgi:hypothetical protein